MTKKENQPRETTGILFTGSSGFLGGLSNERELAEKCPEDFKKDNPWSEYAMKLFFRGGDISRWKWQSEDIQVRREQLACFKGLMRTFDLPTEDKKAVAGWMLSKMLKKVPEYLSNKES